MEEEDEEDLTAQESELAADESPNPYVPLIEMFFAIFWDRFFDPQSPI